MTEWARPLQGLTALIIGGGGAGIGRRISQDFAAAGAAVAVADLDPDRAGEAAAELVAAGSEAIALVGDVRAEDGADRFVADTVAHFGRLDVLVTVVGGQLAFVPAGRLHELTDADWELIFDVNLGYVRRAVRAAVTVFLEQGGGTIVSVGSITGIMSAPEQGGYGAAKAGLSSLARTVAAEYAGDGIRMNVIACGAISTAVAAAAQDDAGLRQIPLGRYGRPSDASAAAVFLASPLASYITGQSLLVDGGVSIRAPFPD
ncbi:SDR family NAD(P)-dependent oxidoreductase [Microlunatus speluncae]|uniref:SDR family NAD(P)-dependent oxidoreductase n=1 Tax=Microlunatus speluncae TaxID=2594267 RepID=UPI001266463E|nr:SDR family oxidoreductase [Microlunatus speluncae]